MDKGLANVYNIMYCTVSWYLFGDQSVVYGKSVPKIYEVSLYCLKVCLVLCVLRECVSIIVR